MYKALTLLIATTCFLSSCKKETGSIATENESGTAKLEVTGTRETSFDPWLVTMQATVFQREPRNLTTEIYTSEISDKTVHFNWTSESECIITFDLKDEGHRIFTLTAEQNLTHLRETN